MKRNRSTLSQGKTYQEIGEFWDNRDLADFWEKTKEASFEVDIKSEVTYYAIENDMSDQLQEIAMQKGISADVLIYLWMREKLQELK